MPYLEVEGRRSQSAKVRHNSACPWVASSSTIIFTASSTIIFNSSSTIIFTMFSQMEQSRIDHHHRPKVAGPQTLTAAMPSRSLACRDTINDQNLPLRTFLSVLAQGYKCNCETANILLLGLLYCFQHVSLLLGTQAPK